MSEKTDAGLLMSAIVKLADRGFGESEFRGSTAMAVERLIGKGVRIDQAIIVFTGSGFSVGRRRLRR